MKYVVRSLFITPLMQQLALNVRARGRVTALVFCTIRTPIDTLSKIKVVVGKGRRSTSCRALSPSHNCNNVTLIGGRSSLSEHRLLTCKPIYCLILTRVDFCFRESCKINWLRVLRLSS